MAIDLNAFPPDVKLALIAVGEEFSSDDTFEQAAHTLQGLKEYVDTLIPFGWPPSEGTRLEDALGLLSEAGCGLAHAQAKKKTLGIGLAGANRAGQTVRTQGRAILTSAKSVLSRQGKTTAATEVQSVLDATAEAGKTGEDLAMQLDQLADAIDPEKAPEAATAASDRGGPATLKPLRSVSVTLREVVFKSKNTVHRTPEEAQRLAQIDGIIVAICRRARDVAEAASKELGNPAILAAFQLDKLYPPRSSASKRAAEMLGEGAVTPSPASVQSGRAP
jgi:hypothetical protein